MKLFLLSLIAILICGCNGVHWSGAVKMMDSSITFKFEDGEPAKGVEIDCMHNNVWPSKKIVSELNILKPSDSDGTFILKHKSYETGGSYYRLGSYTWGHSEASEVICDFIYQAKVVETGNIIKYASPSTIFISHDKKN